MSETGRSEAESALFEYLGLQKGGEAGDFEAFVRARPHIADELRRLWTSWQHLEPLLHTLFDQGGAELSLSNLLGGLGGADEAPQPSILPTLSLRMANGTPRGDESSPARIVERLTAKGGARRSYEPQELVGRGGMGEIHLVRDDDLHRQLAMKVMLSRDVDPPTPESDARRELALARFLDEALITAQLDHPGIVPVHDLGVDDQGRVYFTMKLVKGRNLKRVIDLVHAGEEGWTLNRAVGVILRVCEAVSYAHSKGVLHRDIKPANVMVGRYGETYLMDWGLARLLGATADESQPPLEPPVAVPPEADEEDPGADDSWLFTEDVGVLGTPSYMSPEQARGEVEAVDERSDVYSLGALLYHLITGRTPYLESGELTLPFTLLMKVRRGPPVPLDELAPDAPPTLAAICARAMARGVDQRYASAAEMAGALEDYLEDISEAREEARREARRAELINRFLMETLSFGAPERALGREITVREVLDRAAARIEDALPDHPLDEAALRATIGNLYRKLGQLAEAEPHLERARTLARSALGPEHPQSLTATVDLALLLRQVGRLDDAEALLRPTLALSRRVLGEQHPDSLRCSFLLGTALHRSRARLDEAERLFRETLEGRRAVLGPDHGDTLECATTLAQVLQDQGHLDAAIALQRTALTPLRRLFGERNPDVLTACNNLAGMLQLRGEYDEAERTYREMLDDQRAVYGADHPDTLVVLNNFGTLLRRMGRFDEARPLLEEAVQAQTTLGGPDHPNTLGFMHNLGMLELATGRHARAEELLRESLERAAATLGPEHRYTGRFRHNLGLCLRAQGREDEARAELSAAHAILAAALDADHEWVREAAEALADPD